MNLGVISLILLLAAIVIGFLRNVNVGILSIGFAMILTLLFPDVIYQWQWNTGTSGKKDCK